MDLNMVIYLLFVIFQGATVTGSSVSEESVSHSSPGAPLRPRRVKRCSCSSLMDKECVYFCHLDIIWINTPEKTVPYGLGGPRMRRALQDKDTEILPESTHRCSCARSKDKKCLDFCQTAAELSVLPSSSEVQHSKECSGLRFGGQCIQRQAHKIKKLKRWENIDHSIKSSHAFATLMRKLNGAKDVTQHWTHKKRGQWKHMKTTS
ncbi:endothelin-1 [Discoglossus pictus]